jgi:hypothetical protein
VIAGVVKCKKVTLMPRFIKKKPATAESIPPLNNNNACPVLPSGNPPSPFLFLNQIKTPSFLINKLRTIFGFNREASNEVLVSRKIPRCFFNHPESHGAFL